MGKSKELSVSALRNCNVVQVIVSTYLFAGQSWVGVNSPMGDYCQLLFWVLQGGGGGRACCWA